MSEDASRDCSEELLSGLLDDELEVVEKRAAALHAATCPHCAQTLGQLFAMRAALTVPAPRKVALPKRFWSGVTARLDSVDGLIRATNIGPRTQRPLLRPALLAGCLALVMMAFVTKFFLLHQPGMTYQLTQQHLAVSYSPNDPGRLQTVGFRPDDSWQEMSSNVVSVNNITALHTLYNVGGLPVSVFRLPPNTLDTGKLVPMPQGRQMLYVAGTETTSLAALSQDGGWTIVVARSPLADTVNLALHCPRGFPAHASY